ncbi:MAG: hypothetical protein O3C20_22565 [Verrucomicrobia bacterium]|nr:hypothetical protein [Verrucomicrobiota bacterium]
MRFINVMDIQSQICILITMRDIDELRVDRTSLEVMDFNGQQEIEDIQYWLSRSPLERLEGMEAMRQSMYSYDPVSERLPRLFEVIRSP